jgi:hypothetical protein
MSFVYGILTILLAGSCQKFDRPELVIIPDPPLPAYNPLKVYMPFEGSAKDSGQLNLTFTPNSATYTTGISGQAYQGSASSYFVLSSLGDTLTNMGSSSFSFWVNGTSVANATGLFAIAEKTEFWGNFEVFFEGYAVDNTTGYLKIHMFNKNAATSSNAKGEAWSEVKIPNVFNKWTHLAITYNADNSTLKVYSDGAEVLSKVLATNYGKLAFNNVSGMSVGSFAFMTNPSLTTNHGAESWARNFSGKMDQFRVYNKALSATEVQALFTAKR